MPKLTKCPKCGAEGTITWNAYEMCAGSPIEHDAEPDSGLADCDIDLGWFCSACHTNFITKGMKKHAISAARALIKELGNYSIVPETTTVPWDDEA